VSEAFETIARGASSHIIEGRRSLARDDAQWRALWAAHAGPDVNPPRVDFRTRMVAAVFAGTRPSAGWDVQIVDAGPAGASLTIQVEEHAPAPGLMAAQVLVTPFHIVSLPRFDGDVQFQDVRPGTHGAGRGSATARGTTRAVDTQSSTGLTPRAAGALAYLAGPFSGALVLIVERTSQSVRFHAWQALLGLGVLGVAAVLFLGLAFLVLLFSPTAFRVMLWVAAVSGLAWVVLWAICLVQAYRGQRLKLPLAGSYAERFSRR
jgi:uncharacterized membrane protein